MTATTSTPSAGAGAAALALTLAPAAQQRILADTFSFARWLAVECATSGQERVTVLKSRRHGAQSLLAELPTYAIAALLLDMRQPVDLMRDARDALVLRYLASPETKVRVMAVARQMALDAERDQVEARAGHAAMFSRVSDCLFSCFQPGEPR